MEDTIRNSLIQARALTPKGRHYDLEASGLYTSPRELWLLAGILAGMFQRRNIDVIVGTGQAFGLAMTVCHILDRIPMSSVSSVYVMEDKHGTYFIADGQRSTVANMSVLIVEDFLIDPAHTRRLIAAVEAVQGRVVGLGVIGETTPNFHDIFDTVPYRHTLMSARQLGL